LPAALAEFELELIRKRVKAGMDRAAKQGQKIVRPRATNRRGFQTPFKTILGRLSGEEISRRQAARELGVGYAMLKRLLDHAVERKPTKGGDVSLMY
jgi:putative DNA-invertase from lambdoid prophage Rac